MRKFRKVEAADKSSARALREEEMGRYVDLLIFQMGKIRTDQEAGAVEGMKLKKQSGESDGFSFH